MFKLLEADGTIYKQFPILDSQEPRRLVVTNKHSLIEQA